MGILECASSASAWRGYEYFERNKVGIIQKSGGSVFRADVSESRKRPILWKLMFHTLENQNAIVPMRMAEELSASI